MKGDRGAGAQENRGVREALGEKPGGRIAKVVRTGKKGEKFYNIA